MGPTRRQARSLPWLAIICISLLALWTALLLVIGLREPEGTDRRVIAFAVALGLATSIAAASLVTSSTSGRAIGTIAAGTAVTGIGIFGAATVGLPLLPIGMGLIITGVVAAEGAPTQRRLFFLGAAAAAAVLAVLAAMALAGRGL